MGKGDLVDTYSNEVFFMKRETKTWNNTGLSHLRRNINTIRCEIKTMMHNNDFVFNAWKYIVNFIWILL